MEKKQLKYLNEDTERIRRSAKNLSSIPVRFFMSDMSPSFIQSLLLDYANVIEEHQKN